MTNMCQCIECTPDEAPEPEIDTGDVVHHYPTGEDWIVAYVKGDRLAACGWPQTEAALKDCHLVRKCVPETRSELLQNMAAIVGNDPRAVYARDRLRCNVNVTGDRGKARPEGADARGRPC